MKPVDQTVFGFPGGNCFPACVASILELPISDVPYFMEGVGILDDEGCRVVHDPHPSRAGLLSHDDVIKLWSAR